MLKTGVRLCVCLLAGCVLCMTGCGGEPSRETAIPDDAIKMTPETDVFPPELHSDAWLQPVPLQGPVNTAGAEDAPVVSPDGNTFLFFFTPDVHVPAHEQLTDGVTGIWWTTRCGGEWSKPQRALLSRSRALDGPLCIHDNTLWFCSARPGNYRELDIYTAELVHGDWEHWKNAGELLNSDYAVGELYLTEDGSTMYFDSSRAGGYGGKDIWVLEKKNGQWNEPVNLGATINNEKDQGWLYVTPDGTELWYTEEVGIYRSVKSAAAWGDPELIISGLVGDPAIDAAGTIYFTHHYFTADMEHIESDIYMCCKK